MKKFATFKDWKKYSMRSLDREDIPALTLSILMSVGLIVFLSIFLDGRNMTFVVPAIIIFLWVLQQLIAFFQKRKLK